MESEYDELKNLIKIAIQQNTNYKDRYLRSIIIDAQKIKKNPVIQQSLCSEFSSYSVAISSATTYDVCDIKDIEQRNLQKSDLELLLKIVESL